MAACPTINLKRMSKKNARIAIVKDVLARIKHRRIRTGFYFSGVHNVIYDLRELPNDEGKVYVDAEKLNAKNFIDLLEEKCDVCALGSLFMSHIRVFNQISLGQIDSERDTITQSLHEYFDKEQLDLIETAFERSGAGTYNTYYFSDENLSDSELNDLDSKGLLAYKAIKFGQKYGDSSKRLRAIMLNVVKNDGVFKP